MTERERLLKKMEALKALAERGVNGEKVNAEERLRFLMEKHGISELELEDSGVRTYWIAFKTDFEKRLLHQLAYMHLGRGHAFGCVGKYTNRRRKKVGIECTPAQYIEIEADFAFYRGAMAEEMDIFYSAFIHKNHLFPPSALDESPGDDDDDEVDLERLIKMQAMMGGIEYRTRNRALPDGQTEQDMKMDIAESDML